MFNYYTHYVGFIVTEMALYIELTIALTLAGDLTVSLTFEFQGVLMGYINFQWGVLCGGWFTNPRC